MRILPFDTVRDRPLVTDADVLDRVAAIVGRARRARLWLLYLDEADCQLPLLEPIDLPERRPHPVDVNLLTSLIAGGVDLVGARGMVLAVERGRRPRGLLGQRAAEPGRRRARPDDGYELEWLALAVAAVRRLRFCDAGEACPGPEECRGEAMPLRGSVVVEAGGPRQVIPDDLPAPLDTFEDMF